MTKQRLFNIGLIVMGLLVVAFFGLRTFHAFKRMHGRDPFSGIPPPARQTDVELIRDWMTIPFIAHSYGTPPDVLFEALDIDARENNKKSLKELNDEYFPDVDGYVIATIKAAILADQPPLTPGPPDAPAPPQDP